MSDKDDRTETSAQEPKPTQEGAHKTTSLPLWLSLLAIVLAAVAIAVGLQTGSKKPIVKPRLDVAARLHDIETRLHRLEASFASERRNRMQARLDRLLAEVHELSQLADAKARREIGKAEAILSHLLTSPATRVKARIDLKHSQQRGKAAKAKLEEKAGKPQAAASGAVAPKKGGGEAAKKAATDQKKAGSESSPVKKSEKQPPKEKQ